MDDFGDLREQSQQNLIKFLRNEVDLAETFYEIAERTDHPEHLAQLVEKIRIAIETVHRFEGRIENDQVRSEIVAKLARLKEFVAHRP